MLVLYRVYKSTRALPSTSCELVDVSKGASLSHMCFTQPESDLGSLGICEKSLRGEGRHQAGNWEHESSWEVEFRRGF